ncbi:DUF2232 domain-containing protein [Alicyclobacillus sp. SO9]|uniref:DUF2232 domain-containing protein n=1 Tax=Alicyclobacillus sp. SO9 TaxID=2665646 RepID=UPI0018E82D1D|nr:DUF2232 domain-containing protein [Alicyclobacillus sp. SO9]QQE78936.1 DUF2232 domain-containing protein [Alicyclobacillus sp. SO9]
MDYKPMDRETGIALVMYILLLSLGLLPGFSVLTLWLLPAPIVALTILRSRRTGFILSLIASAALALTGLGWLAVLLAMAFYFLAWSVSEQLTRQVSFFGPLITFILVLIMLELVLLALLRYTGIDILGALSSEVSRTFTQESQALGLSSSNADTIIKQMQSFITLMFPALLAIIAIVLSMANMVILKWLLRDTVQISILSKWNLPYSVLMTYLLSLLLLLFNAFKGNHVLWQTLNSIELIGAFLVGIQGLALIWRKLYQNRIRFLVLILLIIGTTVQFISMALIIIGVFDIANRARHNIEKK